jgi:hypothetical protein
MTSIKTLIAAALVAGTAGVAFASDNGDGAATLDSIRQTQQTVSGFVTEGRNVRGAGEFNYGDANVFAPMPQVAGSITGGVAPGAYKKASGLEYRGSAN